MIGDPADKTFALIGSFKSEDIRRLAAALENAGIIYREQAADQSSDGKKQIRILIKAERLNDAKRIFGELFDGPLPNGEPAVASEAEAGDRDFHEQPEQLSNNSPLPFLALFLLLPVLILAIYLFFPPSVRVNAPKLHYAGGQAVATSEALNGSDKTVTLTIRWDFCIPTSGRRVVANVSLANRETTVRLNPHSSANVSCAFPSPQKKSAYYLVTAKIVRCINEKQLP